MMSNLAIIFIVLTCIVAAGFCFYLGYDAYRQDFISYTTRVSMTGTFTVLGLLLLAAGSALGGLWNS